MFDEKQTQQNLRLAFAFLAEANRQTLYAPDLRGALMSQDYLARALKHCSRLGGWSNLTTT